VGDFDRDFAKSNEINGFAIISRNGNNLASSHLRRRFRLFASVCRFFYFNDTRNGTRRGDLANHPPESSNRPSSNNPPAITPTLDADRSGGCTIVEANTANERPVACIGSNRI
jgi:hypothetical protein